MFMRSRFWIIFGIPLLSFVVAHASTLSPRAVPFGSWEVVREKSWNPNENLRCVFQDQQSLIWLGGSQGLHLLMGDEARPIQIPGYEKYPAEVVGIVQCPDESGIWFASRKGIGHVCSDHLVAKYYPLIDKGNYARFTDLVIGPGSKIYLLYDDSLVEFDRLARGEPTVYSFKRRTKHFTQMVIDPNNPDRLLVCGMPGEIVAFDLQTKRWQSVLKYGTYQGGIKGNAIMADSQNSVWVACVSGWLVRFDSVTGEHKKWQIEDAWKNDFDLTSLEESVDPGHIWIGSNLNERLFQFDIEHRTMLSHNNPFMTDRGRSARTNSLMVDRSGYLWVASKEDGLIRARSRSLHARKASQSQDLEISSRSIGYSQSIVYRDDLVIGVNSKSCFSFDFESQEYSDLLTQNEKARFRSAQSFLVDEEWGIYGIDTDGVWYLDLSQDRESRQWQLKLEHGAKRNEKCTLAQSFDENGNIWFSVGHDLFCYNTKEAKVTTTAEYPRWVTRIVPDKHYVWTICRDVLFRLDTRDGSTAQVDLGQQVTGNVAIADLSVNLLWYGTANGLVAIGRDDLAVEYFGAVKGDVSSITKSSSGLLWILVGNRLRPFDPWTEQLLTFRRQDEFEPPLRIYKGLSIDADGALLLSSWNVLSKVLENSLIEAGVSPYPLLTVGVEKLRKNGATEAIALDTVNQAIEVDHNHMGMIFSVFLPDYSSQKDVRYRYKIDDSQWMNAGGGEIRIGALSPGNHAVTIEAYDSRGIAASNRCEYSISCLAPFWQTSWFYIVLALAAMLVAFGVNEFRVRFILAKQRELEKAHLALSESEARFRRVFEACSDSILVVDEGAHLLTANQHAFERLSIDPAAAEDKLSLSTVLGDSTEVEKLVKQAIDGEEVSYRECGLQLQGGKVLCCQVSVSVCSPEEIRLHIRDITKEVDLESQVRHAQKMEAVGTLAGGIAHDFNNLLSPIVVHSEMVSDTIEDIDEIQPDDREKVMDSMAVCIQAAKKAAGLVKDLLQFAKKTEDKEATIDLRDNCKTVIKLLRGSIPSNVQIHYDLPDEPVQVYCSGQQFEQCLTNIGVNASQAIGTRTGNIHIAMVREPSQGDQRGRWVLTVKDNGSGIEEEVLDRIFDPFFTTKEVGGGSGLGLSMVHGFVEKLGGEVKVDSTLGEGTTLTLYFHESEEAADVGVSICDQKKARDKSKECAGGGLRLVVVDDDPMVLKATSMIMRKRGFSVVTFSNPEHVVDYVEEDPTQLDLIVSDQMMPEMTGLEMAGIIKKIRPELPIVLLTGFCSAVLESEADTRVEAIHMKPLDSLALQATILELTADQTAEQDAPAKDDLCVSF